MVHDVTPGSTGCEECLKIGDQWVHLRICLTCGHVGCCESSKNKHALKHYQSSGHPLVVIRRPMHAIGLASSVGSTVRQACATP